MKRALCGAVAMAAVVVGCTESGTFGSAEPSVTGPTAIVQNHGVVGREGCTPGYWKNHTEDWPATGYSTVQTLEAVFDVPNALGLDNVTLLTALGTGGGGVSALLRHAVAALLNAAHPAVDYPLTIEGVISAVNAALASGNETTIENLKNQLDTWNNLHAPGFCD
jgi:hypothetical protein